MDRRVFFLGAVSVLTPPLVAEAQPGKVYRIGYFSSGPGHTDWSRAFLQGMRELGYVDGQNLVIEYRWAAGKLDQLPRLAAELAEAKVDLIVASPTTGALAAKQATQTIPIVVPISVDHVRAGVGGRRRQPRRPGPERDGG